MVFIAEELFVVFMEAELPFTQEQSGVVIEPRLVVEEEVALSVQHLKLLRQRLVKVIRHKVTHPNANG